MVADPKQITKRGIEGAPLLIMEILSPSTRDRDRTVKAHRYAEVGIPHYWIVDPDVQRIECYRLQATTYTLLIDSSSPARLTHPDFPSAPASSERLFWPAAGESLRKFLRGLSQFPLSFSPPARTAPSLRRRSPLWTMPHPLGYKTYIKTSSMPNADTAHYLMPHPHHFWVCHLT